VEGHLFGIEMNPRLWQSEDAEAPKKGNGGIKGGLVNLNEYSK